jgi:mRNA interferase MazF
MALTFHPRPGTVLICDFSTGFMPPEMVKKRPVVVVSSAHINRNFLCTVVPVSTTKPLSIEPYHVRIRRGSYPFFHPTKPCWVKCDMITTVALRRLDRILVNHRYEAPRLHEDDFLSVINGISNVLSRVAAS